MNSNIQINEYYEQYVSDKLHAQNVLHLSLKIFDDLNTILNIFDEADRKLLYSGALLHDIGYAFNNKSHNKDGRDFILNNNIVQFSLIQNIIIANIIRYHRGKLPKSTHNLLMNLDKENQKKTKILAGICRLADGLDTNHSGVVSNVELIFDGDKFLLKIFSDNKPEKEIITAKSKKDLLEMALGREIKILV